jgi:2,3-diketo-5-methylthio-1-phosphopentane phosphatase
MNKKVFVSDFDGTLTDKDFYQIVIDKYMTEEGNKLYTQWQKEKIQDIDFLGYVYKSINRDEKEILEDILTIPFDKYAKEFIHNIKKKGWDFVVLSAGTRYYIDRLFENLDIRDVTVFSNEGYFKDRGIHLNVDENSWHYSKRYGIDKSKVINKLREQYDTIYFAGDSGPDVLPAKAADLVFAKNRLQDLLRKEGIKYIPFRNYKEVEKYLLDNGVI